MRPLTYGQYSLAAAQSAHSARASVVAAFQTVTGLKSAGHWRSW